MINLNLSKLTHAVPGRQATAALDLGELEVGDLSLSYLRGELEFTRVVDGILVVGSLETEIKTQCIRCLTPLKLPVTLTLEDTIGLPTAEITAERPVRVNEDGWADLTPLIREYAWLALPLNPLCSADCKGLCPVCGGNRNLGECVCEETEEIDPRWEALRDLL
jgi:uncharacterized protein